MFDIQELLKEIIERLRVNIEALEGGSNLLQFIKYCINDSFHVYQVRS